MRSILIAALALLAVPASAQTAEPVHDDALLTACLAENAEAGDVCIGRASTACMATPGGDTTVGMSTCIAAETAQWDGLLNDAYKELTAEPGKRADDLQAVQRSWIAFVDAACAYETGAYEGGTMAGSVGGACKMTNTARRALDLRGYQQEGSVR